MGSAQTHSSVATRRIAYIIGPMAGRPNHGYDVFEKAAKRGREAGLVVLSPHEGAPPLTQIGAELALRGVSDFRDTPLYKQIMRRDIQLLLMADVVYTLPEWYMSVGATFEVELAKMVGTDVLDGAWLLD